MKNLSPVLAVVIGFLLLGSCLDDNIVGDPISLLHWDVFIRVVDQDGNDFFEKNEEYNRDLFKFTIPGKQIRTSFQLFEIDSVVHFAMQPIYFTDIVLDFGNGDTDTIIVMCEPCLSTSTVEQNNISYSYGGEIVLEYNFIDDNDLALEVVTRNCSFCPGWEGNPIVTILIKK
jgi:hypothetical protein